jgi:hypothetical protein
MGQPGDGDRQLFGTAADAIYEALSLLSIE